MEEEKMVDSCPFCDSEEIDDNDLDDSLCTCYTSELGTLVRLQEAIKTIDVSERPFPMAISFSTTGQVLVNRSLSTPIFFKTIDDALEYINDEINELKRGTK